MTDTYRFDETTSRYLTEHDGQIVGRLDVVRQDTLAVLPHTETDPSVQGQGVAGALTRFALDDLRSKELRIVARCPYVAGWIERHPEYADLLAD